MLRLKAIYPILAFFTLQSATAQTHISFSTSDSITLAANPNFQAGWFHRFLFGSLWRDVWATPVQVKKIYLHAKNNTLRITRQTPVKEKVFFLFLRDSLGFEYTFEPILSELFSPFPSEFSALLPRNIVYDQISTLNPYTWLILPTILRELELPYRDTKLVFLPSDELPESYRYHFGNKLGFLRYPILFPPFDIKNTRLMKTKLISSDELIKFTEFNPELERIDELQYLKARIVDLLFGNWNRAADKWMWYGKWRWSHVRHNQHLWEPISMWGAYSQFQRLDGLFSTIADCAIPELEHCGENISSVENITLTGRALDRRLLISYPKQTWDSLASWVQTQISDSVLITALSQLPIPIRDKEGKSLLHLLQARRAQLPKAVNEFYKLSSEYVDIRRSSKAEQVEIRRIGKHIVSVTLYDRSDTLHSPLYQRFFYDDITKEIRVLLLGGDDIITLEGEESSTIKIIIDGGDGKKELIDKTKSRNLFASLNPLSSRGMIFYTSDPEFRITAHSNIQIIYDQARNVAGNQNKTVRLSYRNWGSEWSFSPWFDINPDDGLFIGGGPVYTQYEYRMEPYAQQMSVRAGLATRTNRYRLDAAGEFRDWFRGVRTFLQFHASQLDLSNFFGLGNETQYNQSLFERSFYNVDQRQIFFHAAVDFALAAHLTASGSSTLKLIDNNPQQGTLLDTLKLPFYNRSVTFLKMSAHVQTDTRDSRNLPKQGMYSIVEISYFPNFLDNVHSFYKLQGELRTYFTLEDIPSMTIAFRTVGEKLWGEHPFFESAFLGGNASLRGFERQRFSGDASILGGAEIRTQLERIPFIVPLWSGISAFAETGRVFLTGEHSNRWHNVIGGGLWFSIIKPEYIANFSLARSEDKLAFYATMGFMF